MSDISDRVIQQSYTPEFVSQLGHEDTESTLAECAKRLERSCNVVAWVEKDERDSYTMWYVNVIPAHDADDSVVSAAIQQMSVWISEGSYE
jgi:uncharacterized protein YwlG (UPF0340 family)